MIARLARGGMKRGPIGRRSIRRALGTVGFYGLAILVVVPAFFVLYWMVTMSFKTDLQITGYPPVYWPTDWTLDSYQTALSKYSYGRAALNSLIIAGGSTLLALAVALPAAYSIARWRQNRLATVLLVARMTPGLSYLIPWYIIFRHIGLRDSHFGIILTHTIFTLPLVIWIMIGFFEGVEAELEDAARVDGCSEFGAFWRVALPLARPGAIAAAILAFAFSWNVFFVTLIFAGPNTTTLPVLVFGMISYEEIAWGPLAAAATLMTAPTVLVSLLLQRFIVSGLQMGAIKG